MPSCDQTGTFHFHSSTTSGSASLMSFRMRASISPRQSASSAILCEMSADADSLSCASDLFILLCYLLRKRRIEGRRFPTCTAARHPLEFSMSLRPPISTIVLASLAVALACASLSGRAAAAEAAYPSKLVRVVVPFAAGGSTDLLARNIAQLLNEAWKQPVIVENRVGGAGIVGSELVAKSPPDGCTLLIGTV